MAKPNSYNLLKCVFKKQFKMLRSEIIRLTKIIALIKQLNNMKYIQKRKPVPQANLDVIAKLVALLPADASDNTEGSEYYNYNNLMMGGGPSYVTPEFLSEMIEDVITGATRRTTLNNVRTALQSINIGIFQPTLDLSDISSGELSNSPPQQVPQLKDEGEPEAKKSKSS